MKEKERRRGSGQRYGDKASGIKRFDAMWATRRSTTRQGRQSRQAGRVPIYPLRPHPHPLTWPASSQRDPSITTGRHSSEPPRAGNASLISAQNAGTYVEDGAASEHLIGLHHSKVHRHHAVYVVGEPR